MDFTLLRLLLALDVVLAHYRELTGFGQWWSLGFSSTVAVQAFFVISGWIVTASYETSDNAGSFFVRRIARLYPLYVAVVLAQALGVVILVQLPANTLAEVSHYLAANLTFANFAKPSLLGFLDDARVRAINPALWTLKIEVMFYISVPVLVGLSRRYPRHALPLLFIASTVFYYLAEPFSAELAKQLPGQLRFFVAGMICRQFMATRGSSIRGWSSPVCALLAVSALGAAHSLDGNHGLALLQPIFVAVFVTFAARLLPKLGTMPDISFGVYLVHAPLIQFLHQYGLGLIEPGPLGLLLILLVTMVLSTTLSYAIEQPAIRWGQRFSRHLSERKKARFESAVKGLHEAK